MTLPTDSLISHLTVLHVLHHYNPPWPRVNAAAPRNQSPMARFAQGCWSQRTSGAQAFGSQAFGSRGARVCAAVRPGKTRSAPGWSLPEPLACRRSRCF